jgi:hypothetical protein
MSARLSVSAGPLESLSQIGKHRQAKAQNAGAIGAWSQASSQLHSGRHRSLLAKMGKTRVKKRNRVKGFASRGFACYHSDDED